MGVLDPGAMHGSPHDFFDFDPLFDERFFFSLFSSLRTIFLILLRLLYMPHTHTSLARPQLPAPAIPFTLQVTSSTLNLDSTYLFIFFREEDDFKSLSHSLVQMTGERWVL